MGKEDTSSCSFLMVPNCGTLSMGITSIRSFCSFLRACRNVRRVIMTVSPNSGDDTEDMQESRSMSRFVAVLNRPRSLAESASLGPAHLCIVRVGEWIEMFATPVNDDLDDWRLMKV